MGKSELIDTAADRVKKPPVLGNLARNAVLSKLKKISRGHLLLSDGKHKHSFGAVGGKELTAELSVHDPAFYSSVMLNGSLGAAESYIRGEWETNDLVTLVRLMVRNRKVLDHVDSGMAQLFIPLRRFQHWVRRNSLKTSPHNIKAHYDLSNKFYSLFLDPTMAYSSAVFPSEASNLEEGSREKFDRLCRKIGLNANDRVLEIGTGWGGFAVHAAEKYGCRVTTTTLSNEQYNYTRDLIKKRGLKDRIELLKQDYRQLRGTFDKLVSIEMIEAVGHRYIPDFFKACCRLLAPGGLMALQGITISGQYYSRYIQSVDFIQQYIFPGSSLISLENVLSAINRVTDFQPVHLEDVTLHYARTLSIWKRNFLDRLDKVRELGFSDKFIRMWEYYLSYCEGGFRERFIGDVQLVIARPGFLGAVTY